MSLRVAVAACLAAISLSVTVYDPPEAGTALDALEKALVPLVNNRHLPAKQMAKAKKVAADVEDIAQFLDSAKGKALSKQDRAAKVMGGIKELQDLQESFKANLLANPADRKTELMKQLEAKEAELAKEKKMMKVLTLEKALAEKKLALQKLIDMKHAKEVAQSQQEDAKEMAAREEMIANVLKMAKDLQASKGANTSMTHAVSHVVQDNSKLLSTVNAYLENRIKTLSDKMAQLDAAEKKRESEIKATLQAGAVAKDNSEELKKSKAMLDMLMKKEHRNYLKTRAPLQSEYTEVTDAVKSIKKGDVTGLAKVMSHMQSEMKALQAKSHKFLY
jgi:hypothetical protein